MKLIQLVTLKDNHTEYKKKHTVVKQDFNGVKEREKMENTVLHINLAESKQPFNHHDHKDIKPLDASETALAEFLQPTTNGKLVDIRYMLEVKCKMEGVC